MREIILWNDGWHFHKGDIHVPFPTQKGPTYAQAKTERYKMGPAARAYDSTPNSYVGALYDGETWESVTLPHDYIIVQAPDQQENQALGYFRYENAWYRKTFSLEEADAQKRLILDFEGIATQATVYLNGCLVGRNFCGYTSFEVEITDFVTFDEPNVLAIYVNAQEHEGWWYEGAGIYRNVYLRKTDRVAIDRYGVYAKPQKKDGHVWSVALETTLVSIESEVESVSVHTELCDRDGLVVASAEIEGYVPSYGKAVLHSSVSITDPHLWDVDAPYLYRVRTTVLKKGEACDTDETRIGFRTYRCDPEKGFFLNDRPLKIKGVCAHEDCGLFGKAVPTNVHHYRMKLLKKMGANGYRTSHYQQNAAILDATDELGFIVLDEARWFTSTEEGIEQMEELVKRDRNRPSVFFWSLGNEEPFQSNERGRRITKRLMEALKRLDDTRVITSAVDRPATARVFDGQDVIGINYNLSIFDSTHELYPEKAIFSSENCATGTTRAWYDGDCPQKGYLSAYDKDTNAWFRGREYTWKAIMARDFIMGGYQWDGFEHRGETVWPRLCSQSGAIDLYLQKKDAFYQNQSHWLETPMIHLLPHWNLDVPAGENVQVWAYTNCQAAELFLDGVSLGKQSVEPYTHLEWRVPYGGEKLEAVGYINGKVVATDVKERSGKPIKLMLHLENEISSVRDAAIVTCYCVDAKGRIVPNAHPTVEFFTNSFGKVMATGSDVADPAPVTDCVRRMREGLITVAVGVARPDCVVIAADGVSAIEPIVLYAKADGLTSAKLTVTIGKKDSII